MQAGNKLIFKYFWIYSASWMLKSIQSRALCLSNEVLEAFLFMIGESLLSQATK